MYFLRGNLQFYVFCLFKGCIKFQRYLETTSMSPKRPRQRSLPFTMMYFLLYNVDGVAAGGQTTTAFRRARAVSSVTKEVANIAVSTMANSPILRSVHVLGILGMDQKGRGKNKLRCWSFVFSVPGVMCGFGDFWRINLPVGRSNPINHCI